MDDRTVENRLLVSLIKVRDQYVAENAEDMQAIEYRTLCLTYIRQQIAELDAIVDAQDEQRKHNYASMDKLFNQQEAKTVEKLNAVVSAPPATVPENKKPAQRMPWDD